MVIHAPRRPAPCGRRNHPRRMRGGEPPLPLRASPAPTKRRKKTPCGIRVSTYRTFLPHGTRQRRPAKIRPWVPAGAADRWRAKCTDKERQFAAWEIAGEGGAGCQGKRNESAKPHKSRLARISQGKHQRQLIQSSCQSGNNRNASTGIDSPNGYIRGLHYTPHARDTVADTRCYYV